MPTKEGGGGGGGVGGGWWTRRADFAIWRYPALIRKCCLADFERHIQVGQSLENHNEFRGNNQVNILKGRFEAKFREQTNCAISSGKTYVMDLGRDKKSGRKTSYNRFFFPFLSSSCSFPIGKERSRVHNIKGKKIKVTFHNYAEKFTNHGIGNEQSFQLQSNL